MLNRRPRIFQFWDKPDPPAEVVELMETWRGAHGGWTHRLFDIEAAAELIRETAGADYLKTFEACALPAMKADVFRYAALHAEGGVYVDADVRCDKSIKPLWKRSRRGVLLRRKSNIANDVLIVKAPGDPLIAYAMEQAMKNVADQTRNDVWSMTGPGIMTKLNHRDDDYSRTLFEGFKVLTIPEIDEYVTFKWDLDYKKDGEHWVHKQKTTSIFNTPKAR
ncbi:MAG: glycosyltransferase [Pseudomonadota bacterium]